MLAECQDCFHHFQVDPSGDIQSAACPDCGGKRMLRDQPSPTVSDGTLRNMVDSDSQKDQGGNPLGEGTIMGNDGENPWSKRDNYMHGHVLAALFDDFEERDRPHREREREIREMEDSRARARNRDWQEHEKMKEMGHSTLCSNCGKDAINLHGECENCHALWNVPPLSPENYTQGLERHPDPWMDNEPGSLTIPKGHPSLWSHILAALVDPTMRCPKCGHEVMFDPKSEDAFCSHCDWNAMIHRDEPWGEHHFYPAQLEALPTQQYDFGPVHQGKTATIPTGFGTMYHVSPRQNRESILKHGLQGHEGKHESPWDYTWDQPRGNYLFDNIDDARMYAHGLKQRQHGDHRHDLDEERQYEYPEQPNDFDDWPEDKQVEWEEESDEPKMLEEDPKGYDIYSVQAHGLPIAQDPETTSVEMKRRKDPNLIYRESDPHWDLGRVHDEYERQSEPLMRNGEIGYPDIDELHNEVGSYHGSEPKRYFVPTAIHPQRISLEEHYPLWHMNPDKEEALYEDTHPNEVPSPWMQVPLTERPFPGHESKALERNSSATQSVEGFMPKYERTNNMEPYDSWMHGSIQKQAGPVALAAPEMLAGGAELGAGMAAGQGLAGAAGNVLGNVPVIGGLMKGILGGGGSNASTPPQPAYQSPLAEASVHTSAEWPNEHGEWPWDVKHEPELDPETGRETIHLPPHYPNVLEYLERSLPDPTDPRYPEIQKAIKEHQDYLDHIGYPRPAGNPADPRGDVLAALMGHYETPASNPDVGVKHDDPEDVDQKEFNDQDKSPKNLKNPETGEEGGATKGEDEVRDQAGFGPNTVERITQLGPLLLHFYHSPDSGASDPMIKALHEMLEAEIPGYLDKGDDAAAEEFIRSLKQHPDHHTGAFSLDPNAPRPKQGLMGEGLTPGEWTCPMCHTVNPEGHICYNCHASRPGSTPEELREPGGREFIQHPDPLMDNEPGSLTFPQEWSHTGAVPPIPGITDQTQPAGAAIAPEPTTSTPPGGAFQAGHCTNCGTTLGPDGKCPTCSATKLNPVPGQQAQQTGMGLPQQQVQQQAFAATHPGPVTPQQIAAVQEWLIEHGRVEEVPNVPLDPGNPEYVKILSEIRHDPNVPPTVTPEEQTQPPAPQMSAPGAMPMPGPGETGGQPMQPLSSFLPELVFEAADNIAGACPNCGSHTTGLVGDSEHHAHCHACSHVWKEENLIDDSDRGESNTVASVREALDHSENDHAGNPIGVPAADQEGKLHTQGEDDPSLTWKDSNGEKLQPERTYMMKSPQYDVPDMVRVKWVKPDGIEVETQGTYANEPDSLKYPEHITKEEMDLGELQFEPVADNADERQQEPPPGREAPLENQIPASGQTTDEHDNSYPPYQSSTRVACERCGHTEFSDEMLSPTSSWHECYKCGNQWEQKENAEGFASNTAAREWVMGDDDDEFNERVAAMAKARQQTRNLGDVASRDPHLQEVSDRLAQRKQERVAGKNFTPSEQRTLIDEDGEARNADLLDLSGTHYESRFDLSGKANAENAPDEHMTLLLGL